MPNWTSKDRKPDIPGVKRAKPGDLDGNAPGRIVPGSAPLKQHGTPNKITRDLKVGIVDAAVAHGSDGHGTDGLPGYLYFLAHDHPKAFASLLGRLLPLQVTGTATFIGTVNVVAVPKDTYLSAEQIRRLNPLPELPTPTPVEPEPEQVH